MVLLLFVVATGAAALLFSWFHLMLRAEAWPPSDIESPNPAYAAGAAVVLALSVPAVAWGVARLGRDRRRSGAVALGAGWLLGAAGTALAVADLASAPFAAAAHAYTSLFFAVGAFHAALLAVGLVMVAVVEVSVWSASSLSAARTASVNAGLWWYASVGMWLAGAATVHVSPQVLVR